MRVPRSLLALSAAALALCPDAALATPDPTPAVVHGAGSDAAHHQLLARAVAKKSSSFVSRKKASSGKKSSSTKKSGSTTTSKKALTSTKKAAVKPARADVWDGTTTISQSGKLLVGAMQLVVVSDNAVVVLDKAEVRWLIASGNCLGRDAAARASPKPFTQLTLRQNNPGQIKGKPGWGQHFNVKTGKNTMLPINSNTFCSGGTILSNGTLVALGGNPTYDALNKTQGVRPPLQSTLTQQLTYNDAHGQTGLRVFPKCSDTTCTVFDQPTKLRISSGRWYPSLTRLSDGSIFVTSGTIDGTFVGGENSSLVNYSHEYYPAKSINNGMPIFSRFLADASPSYLFPVVYYLPDDTIFMAANKLAMRYDWRNNKEIRLPSLTARINYPWTAASALLPYTPENNYTPEILFCGGSNTDDKMSPKKMTSQMATVGFCQRMRLNDYGIKQGWQTEGMPSPRFMGEAVIMPDGKLMLVNGAQTGVSGFNNIGSMTGNSNADNPVLQPWIYDPLATRGSRFSRTGMPTSKIPRMYHSTATDVFPTTSSNPYGTEYRVEYISPPYMSMTRPTIVKSPSKLGYGTKFTLSVTLPAGTTASQVVVNLLELGYKTHGLSFDQRMVKLVVNSVSSDGKTLSVTGPPSNRIFPPGAGWIYVLANGVPAIIGTGAAPPFDKAAYANMIKRTSVDDYHPPGAVEAGNSRQTKKKSSRRALDSSANDL